MFAFWRYSVYSILVGRYSRSLNSLLFLMIWGLFKSTMVSFKRHKEIRGVHFHILDILYIFSFDGEVL